MRSTVFVVICAALLGLYGIVAAADDAKATEPDILSTQPQFVDGSYFVETFADPIEGRWVKSKNEMYTGNNDIKQQAATGTQGIPGDTGLALMGESKRYGISAPFSKPTVPGKELVVQYELKLDSMIDCAGAYLKLLEADNSKLEEMEEKTGYTIMFGPDKCGNTNKVHLILRFKNEKSGEYKEHHLKSPPTMKNDKLPHLYTFVLREDNSFEVFIDQVSAKAGSLTSADDWETPFTPPKEIDDPTDKKPADWVDEEKIKDPEASKPADWDEDAPKQIEDADATMPSGWDVDAPEKIADPDAAKPDDWNDDEDGPWEAPQVANPACKVGCGPWTRPMKANPDYKGKWTAPMITNPEYKGVWKAKRIENPAYYEVENPAAFLAPIGSVAVEVWVHKPKGIMFDNIVVADSLSKVQDFGAATWKVRVDREKAALKAEEDKAKATAREKKLAAGGFLVQVEEYTKMAAEQFAAYPWISFPVLLLFFFMIFKFCRGADRDEQPVYKPRAAPKTEKETKAKSSDPLDEKFEQALKEDDGNLRKRAGKGEKEESEESEEKEEPEDSKDK